jgi:hypothetical protein
MIRAGGRQNGIAAMRADPAQKSLDLGLNERPLVWP